MHKIKLEEARERLAELIDDAVSGEDVVISRGDGADVRLVPVVKIPRQPRKGGGLKGMLQIKENFDDPLPEFEAYS